MIKKLLNFIPVGSTVLAVTTLVSYSMGLLRDRIFAQTFGASRALDAYNAAFIIPDLLFNILIAGGIAAAFVPILTELLNKDKEKAQEYANSVTTAATGVMILSAIVITVFAGPISTIVAPGFDPASQALVAKILRLLSISPILFGASNAIGAILITQKRFLFYGISPALYNLGIILGALLLAPSMGILGVAVGTLLGAIFHLTVRLASLLTIGFKLKPGYAFSTAEFRKTLRLMLPKMFGHPVELATFWGFTAIASTLIPGSVTVLNFARNFQSVPVSLIGITIATTSFPILSGAFSERTAKTFWSTFKNSFITIGAGSILAAIIIFFLREHLIRILLGGGAFGEAEIQRTAAVLGIFCLSMPTESLIHLVARAFYATKNTVIPVMMSILGLIIAIPGGYMLTKQIGLVGLPLVFFIASATELVILLVLLYTRMRKLEINQQ